MSIDEKAIKFPKNFCWETNGQLAELIKQAEGALQYLEKNSVGYYYYWMLEELKKYAAKAPGNSTEIPDRSPATEQPDEYANGTAGRKAELAAITADSICADLMEACDGHPYAKIKWPHYLLHNAAYFIRKQQKALDRQPEREAIELDYEEREQLVDAIDQAMEQVEWPDKGEAALTALLERFELRMRG